jgi:hypothetical protein
VCPPLRSRAASQSRSLAPLARPPQTALAERAVVRAVLPGILCIGSGLSLIAETICQRHLFPYPARANPLFKKAPKSALCARFISNLIPEQFRALANIVANTMQVLSHSENFSLQFCRANERGRRSTQPRFKGKEQRSGRRLTISFARDYSRVADTQNWSRFCDRTQGRLVQVVDGVTVTGVGVFSFDVTVGTKTRSYQLR